MNKLDPMIDIRSMSELEEDYRKYVTQSAMLSLDLGCWLPSLGRNVRPLMPGELCFLMADTGVGKSMVLQQIAMLQSEAVLFFEMELPRTLMFERFMSFQHRLSGYNIEQKIANGEAISLAQANHIFVCDATRLSKDDMRALIETASAKMETEPKIIFVDYIGLMASGGKSRYERVSAAAEDLKVLAKETDTVIIAATQMHRMEDGRLEPDLHDAKDSGSIENSCGLLLAMWRNEQNKNLGYIRILKCTKGTGGLIIPIVIDGARMRVEEMSHEKEIGHAYWEDDGGDVKPADTGIGL